MRLIARIMLALFAVASVTGPVAAKAAQCGDAQHEIVAHDTIVPIDHEHGPIQAFPEEFDAQSGAVGAGDEPACGTHCAHIHVSCCSSSVALPSDKSSSRFAITTAVDFAIDRSILVLGDLRYSLLRPPSQPI